MSITEVHITEIYSNSIIYYTNVITFSVSVHFITKTKQTTIIQNILTIY